MTATVLIAGALCVVYLLIGRNLLKKKGGCCGDCAKCRGCSHK